MGPAVAVTIGLLGCALSLSCASFPGNQLEAVDLTDLDQPAERPSMEYELVVRTAGEENLAARVAIQERVDSVFASSNAFDSYRAGVVGLAPLYLDLDFDNIVDPEAVSASAFITGITLLVLPAYAKDEYRLVARLYRDGEFAKQYEYADYVGTWIQLFLFPLSFTHWPLTVADGVIDNMFANLIRDMERDGFLSDPGLQLDTTR